MAGPVYLVDRNILIRLVKRDHPENALVRKAVNNLKEKVISLAFRLQNMAEFLNASTRPKERNGFGICVKETEDNAREIERSFIFPADNKSVYLEWRPLVTTYRVSGIQVHDARLAAAMFAHQIDSILTFNASDFSRFECLTAIHPNKVLA